MRAKLEDMTGAVFDLTYMQGQVIDHQKAVVLLQWEIGQGQDAPMQQWAAATLPVVLGHLEMAKKLLAELAAQRPQASSGPISTVPQLVPPGPPCRASDRLRKVKHLKHFGKQDVFSLRQA
jgi:hypothetical protein